MFFESIRSLTFPFWVSCPFKYRILHLCTFLSTTRIIVVIKGTHNFPIQDTMFLNPYLNHLSMIFTNLHFIGLNDLDFLMSFHLIFPFFFCLNNRNSLPLMCLLTISAVIMDLGTFFDKALIDFHWKLGNFCTIFAKNR